MQIPTHTGRRRAGGRPSRGNTHHLSVWITPAHAAQLDRIPLLAGESCDADKWRRIITTGLNACQPKDQP